MGVQGAPLRRQAPPSLWLLPHLRFRKRQAEECSRTQDKNSRSQQDFSKEERSPCARMTLEGRSPQMVRSRRAGPHLLRHRERAGAYLVNPQTSEFTHKGYFQSLYIFWQTLKSLKGSYMGSFRFYFYFFFVRATTS